MPWLLNILYLLALLLFSPWLFWRFVRTGRYRENLRAKLFGFPALASSTKPRVWFHGVSVGEIHLLRQVLASFRQRFPNWEIVVTSTTDTGLAEAKRCFPDLTVIPFPFDFSWAVGRTLRAINPTLLVLAEGEMWPNLVMSAKKRGVRIAVLNARMSPRSLGRYRRLGFLARWLMRQPDLILAQSDDYAANFRALGAAKVVVTGSVKYDGARTDRANPATQELRSLLRIEPEELVLVAGSTQAPEEEIILRIYHQLRTEYPQLRLMLVPRQKDRFDEVARLLERNGEKFQRRSQLSNTGLPFSNTTILVDTIGELGALWGLADVAFVGGSMDGVRGGQNMIEPAAYGAAVLFGPHVWNFREPVRRLVEVGGAIQISEEKELEAAIKRLLGDPKERENLGRAAREFVLQQQGATERTLDHLEGLLHRSPT